MNNTYTLKIKGTEYSLFNIKEEEIACFPEKKGKVKLDPANIKYILEDEPKEKLIKSLVIELGIYLGINFNVDKSPMPFFANDIVGKIFEPRLDEYCKSFEKLKYTDADINAAILFSAQTFDPEKKDMDMQTYHKTFNERENFINSLKERRFVVEAEMEYNHNFQDGWILKIQNGTMKINKVEKEFA